MKRLRAIVSGKVQMTGYRARVVNLVNFLGLVGFVQNLDKAAELLSELIVVNKQILALWIINNEVLKDIRDEIRGFART